MEGRGGGGGKGCAERGRGGGGGKGCAERGREGEEKDRRERRLLERGREGEEKYQVNECTAAVDYFAV